jgi:hypothetical protein
VAAARLSIFYNPGLVLSRWWVFLASSRPPANGFVARARLAYLSVLTPAPLPAGEGKRVRARGDRISPPHGWGGPGVGENEAYSTRDSRGFRLRPTERAYSTGGRRHARYRGETGAVLSSPLHRWFSDGEGRVRFTLSIAVLAMWEWR